MCFFSAVGGRFTIIVIIDIIIIIMIVVIINMIVIIIIIIIIIFIIVIIMMNEIGIDKKHQLYIIKKMINIAIRATYYIFCCRNRNWDSPDLMQICFIFFFFFFFFFFCFCVVLFCFCFWFFLLIIPSPAAFVNYLYVARFTIVHSKKQIKLPLLLYS